MHANLGWLLAALRHDEPETVESGRVETGAGAGHRGDALDAFTVVRVALGDHVQEALAGGIKARLDTQAKQIFLANTMSP